MVQTPLDVRTSSRGTAVVVAATGEVDLANAARLREAGVAALEPASAGGLLVLDLSGLTFMDSAGLGAVVQVLKAAKRLGLRVAVVVLHPLLVRLFAITGVDKAFPVSATLDEAIAAV